MIPAGLAVVLLSAAVLTSPLPPARPLPEPPRAKSPWAEESGLKIPAAAEAALPPATAGIVCRDPRLTGDPKPDIIDVQWLACGIDDPVRVTSIDRIALSPPILTGCRTARRLADWLTGVARPEARAWLGSGILEVHIMGSYACRTQNNAGRWRSEHARGRAVDIGGFTLGNGAVVTVAEGWGDGAEGGFLHSIWEKGCGPFSTVLGPAADHHHRDHFHLDLAPRSGAPYCR